MSNNVDKINNRLNRLILNCHKYTIPVIDKKIENINKSIALLNNNEIIDLKNHVDKVRLKGIQTNSRTLIFKSKQ